MPLVRGAKSDLNRENLAGLCDCCLLTEARALERIPGWHYLSAPEQRWVRRRERGRRGGGWGTATLWLGTWSSLSLQLTGEIESICSEPRDSLHMLSCPLPFFFFALILALFFYTPLSPPPLYTQSFFLTVIHAAHLQCFQERQIKRGFSYRSVTLELWASWITINSIKRHSLCFAPSPVDTQEACPCHC